MWNMEARGVRDMKNEGMSLVELLVAFAVSGMVLAGAAYLIVTCLTLYGRTDAHVLVQSEAQTAMNLVLDHVMEAQGICMEEPSTGGNTECILLGDWDLELSGTTCTAYFKGTAVCFIQTPGTGGAAPEGELYLATYPNNVLEGEDASKPGYARLASKSFTPAEMKKEGDVRARTVEAAMGKVKSDINGKTREQRLQWLMAQHIQSFRITLPNPAQALKTETVYYWNGETEEIHYFEEPFTLDINIELEYDYQSGSVDRDLSDSASVRSRLYEVYVKRGGTMKEYIRK